jgi:hypothetical protein
MNTAQKLTQQAMDKFLADNRDMLACMKDSTEVIFERTSAAASLDKEVRQDLANFSESEYLNQSGYAGREAKETFSKAVYLAIARAFFYLMTNGSLRLATKFTDEANEQQLELRYLIGDLSRPAPAPAAPAPLSFEEQVRWDWDHLPIDEIKKKKAMSAQYRQTITQILDSTETTCQITTMHDGRKM